LDGVVSHGGCTSTVTAAEEDKDGFFRTEVQATLNNLNVEDVFTVDRITLGMVSVYRRHWFDNGKAHAKRVRVAPYGCSIVNAAMKGQPVKDYLPAPFHYSIDRCEAYLRADEPDPTVEAEIRTAIAGTPSRLLYVKNFGRIYFGEWMLLPTDDWHMIHQICMVSLRLGSPQSGNGGGPTGQNDGTGG
jgi:hypothetical protein